MSRSKRWKKMAGELTTPKTANDSASNGETTPAETELNPIADVGARLRLIGDDFDREARLGHVGGLRRDEVPTQMDRQAVPWVWQQTLHLGGVCHTILHGLDELYVQYDRWGVPQKSALSTRRHHPQPQDMDMDDKNSRTTEESINDDCSHESS